MKETKVYLVGAGPGDVGLLTIRAQNLLQEANAVIYDALVGSDILSQVAEGAELIYVGKRAGKHAMKQSDINRTIIDAAQRLGGTIVRLKGGDPFVFGRGGEEMQALHEANIAYDIVPGVTAGIAGAAYCGIPVTHRAISRSVTLITAFSEEGGVPDQDWEALARMGGTLVFYMSMRVVPLIAQRLVTHGMDVSTPAAIISEATHPNQRLHLSTLGVYQDETISYEGYAPGLWVVGNVVEFACTYQWRGGGALQGKSILVTRAEAQASRLVALLQARGATAKLLPIQEISSITDWIEDDSLWGRPRPGAWIAFTSVNGVHQYMQGLSARGVDSRFLSGYGLAAIGPATSEALRAYSLIPDLVPQDNYTARGLADALLGYKGENKPQEVLLPTSRLSSGELAACLMVAGISVRELFIYDNIPIEYTREQVERLFESKLDWITFCSSSAVHHFMNLIERLDLRSKLMDIDLAVIGPITAETLRGYGLAPKAQPTEVTLSALVSAIEEVKEEDTMR
ncbi:MAG: uroporphyrinogen-III C-methyltransferase [Porphyromonadaceae bacterium]|nr:uroporphyrinogen-III C-methyltransferase [Porphyromonadaceae bacterium]